MTETPSFSFRVARQKSKQRYKISRQHFSTVHVQTKTSQELRMMSSVHSISFRYTVVSFPWNSHMWQTIPTWIFLIFFHSPQYFHFSNLKRLLPQPYPSFAVQQRQKLHSIHYHCSDQMLKRLSPKNELHHIITERETDTRF